MLDHHDGILMEAMEPLYAKMKSAKGRVSDEWRLFKMANDRVGKGTHLQRVTLLEDTMQRGEPFGGFIPVIRAAMKYGMKTLQPQLLEDVKSVFEGVSNNFDLMFVFKELPDEQRDALRQRIRQYVDYANSRINEDLTLEMAMATMG